jgi:uncharacterized protein (TIGR02757 family)
VKSLGASLDLLYHDFNAVDSASDPVHRVRPFGDPRDREVAGFCAGALAFGRVGSVLNSIDTLFRIMGPHPAAFVRSFEPDAPQPELRAMVHRWTRGEDIAALLWILRQMLERSGTLEDYFLEGFTKTDEDIGPALDSFSTRALALDVRPAYDNASGRGRAVSARGLEVARRGAGDPAESNRVPKRPGVCYFFPRPSAGSACKRLNLFLRWMVRADEVDLGVWSRVPKGKLIVPLDTHVIRLGRCLKLTRYTSPGWRMAADITASLRELDPADPVRFDFSLCHVGMMNACGFGRKQGDAQCPLKGLCHPRQRGARR